jgi:DNA gyrase subunit A
MLVKTEELLAKSTRSTQGVAVVTLRKNQTLTGAEAYTEGMLHDPARYRKKFPAIGALPSEADQMGEQVTLNE